jgi:DNA-binding NarL/FixJ family response regulator
MQRATGARVEGEYRSATIVTACPAVGDAIALACRRRGFECHVLVAPQPSPLTEPNPLTVEVIVLDLHTDEPSVLETLSVSPGRGQRVIAVGSHQSRDVYTSISASISADSSIAELIAVMSTSAAGHPLPSVSDGDNAAMLTSRELEVLRVLLTGASVAAMGEYLGIATSTVRTHIQNVLVKLDVNSRAEAAAWALRSGLEPVDSLEAEV